MLTKKFETIKIVEGLNVKKKQNYKYFQEGKRISWSFLKSLIFHHETLFSHFRREQLRRKIHKPG